MILSSIATREVATAGPKATIAEIVRIMTDKNVGSVVITLEGAPVGIITDRDIVVRVLAAGLDPVRSTVDTFMTQNLFTLQENLQVSEALDLVKDLAARRFPLVNAQGKLSGIVSLDDILHEFAKRMQIIAGIIAQSSPELY